MPRSSSPRSPAAAVACVLAIAASLAACSTAVEVQTTATDVTAPTPETPTSAAVENDITPEPGVTEGSDVAQPDPGADRPLHLPASGEPLAVVGVAFDATVALRSGARHEAVVIAELPALFDEAVGTGEARTGTLTDWWRVRVPQGEGWIEASSMARLGATTDVTADVAADLGRTPTAPNMRTLGRLVANTRIGDDAEARIVLSGAPRVDDLGEVIFDIVGLADDSIVGERLVVFGTPRARTDGFALRSVEATVFCARGVTADGRCT